eukprot:9549304-Ditylum_brightwellii.AAC.1
MKDNEDKELNRLELEYDKMLSDINFSLALMLSDIMFKCKKQCYGKSVCNTYSGNNNGKEDYRKSQSHHIPYVITATIKK